MLALRVVRIMRLSRGLRIIRILRFFTHLRIIVAGIMSSFRPLLWAVLVLFVTTYLFGMCMLPFVADELASLAKEPTWTCIDDPRCQEFERRFGSMLMTTYTLYMSVTGGVSWGEPNELLMTIHPAMGLFYALYVAFALLCVMNTITGVFVETATKNSQIDEQNRMAEVFADRMKWFKDVEDLFRQTDVDNSGKMTLDEFVRSVRDVRLKELFRKLGLDLNTGNANSVFRLLDFEGSGEIDFENFVEGFEHFTGPARSIDIARIRFDFKRLRKELAAMQRDLVLRLNMNSIIGQPSFAVLGGSETKSESLAPTSCSVCLRSRPFVQQL